MTILVGLTVATTASASRVSPEGICSKSVVERIVQDYSDIANRYHEYGANATTDWLLGYGIVVNFLSPLTGKAILDYGCGTGKFSRFMDKQGAIVFGVDTSHEMINIANGQGGNQIHYEKILSGQIPSAKDSSTDAVTMNFVLCTINDRQESLRILKEAYRILKVGGKLSILNVNWDEANGKEFIPFRLAKYESLTPGQPISVFLKNPPTELRDYFWPEADYLHLIQEAGFKNLNVRKPLGSDPSIPWINETETPPFTLIFAEK